MGHSVEGHQMMLARGVQRDFRDQHQLVMFFVECGVQHRIRVGVQPGEHLPVGPGDPRRGLLQPLAVGVLTHRQQQFADRSFSASLVELRDVERDRVALRHGNSVR